jgi:hypothetical protein
MFIEFPIPAGEGSGPSDGVLYSLIVDVGGQRPAPVAFSYAAPVITSIFPSSGPTVGGSTLLISGYNFGLFSAPFVSLGLSPSAAAVIPNATSTGACINAVRLNETTISCTLPEGAGTALGVLVSVANLTGCSASGPSFASGVTFSYFPPTLTALSRTYAVTTGGTVPAPAWTIPTENMTAPLDGSSQLSGSTTGGYLLTISGSNLGPWPTLLGPSASLVVQPPTASPPGGIGSLPSISCVFVSSVATRSAPSCDGYESFLGEGEVAKMSS